LKFNRRLKPFQAISFDLDDTLYHNAPIMVATSKKMSHYFDQRLPAGKKGCYEHHYWFSFRQQVLQTKPFLRHDIGQMRLQCYYLGIKKLGFNAEQADKMASQALQYFMAERSNFSLPQATHQLLTALKSRWPLVAITNGNVDTKKIGLHSYFTNTYHAGENFQLKPAQDMFDQACLDLTIPNNKLLHVGDCGRSDVYGANRSGCQSAWLSSYQVGQPITSLPTIELADITDLYQLL
jgi:putative hydrolase of the HAD superfamily